MAIITADELTAYNGMVFDTGATLPTMALNHADDIISNYIGYNPVSSDYTDRRFSGNGKNVLKLDAYPVTAVNAVEINDIEYDETNFSVIDNDKWRILSEYTLFSTGYNNVKISFTAGWAELSLPTVFKTVALQIATLFLSGKDGAIAVRGRVLPNGQTEFVSRNYTPFLELLSKYRYT